MLFDCMKLQKTRYDSYKNASYELLISEFILMLSVHFSLGSISKDWGKQHCKRKMTFVLLTVVMDVFSPFTLKTVGTWIIFVISGFSVFKQQLFLSASWSHPPGRQGSTVQTLAYV